MVGNSLKRSGVNSGPRPKRQATNHHHQQQQHSSRGRSQTTNSTSRNGTSVISNEQRTKSKSVKSQFNTETVQLPESAIRLRFLVSEREALRLVESKRESISALGKDVQMEFSLNDSVRGAAERVFTVAGAVESLSAVSKSLVSILTDAPSEMNDIHIEDIQYSLRLLLPNSITRLFTGPDGLSLKDSITASGVKILTSESLLPLSSERSVLLSGGVDKISSALVVLAETVFQNSDRVSGKKVRFYHPLSVAGVFAHPNHWQLSVEKGVQTPFNPYGVAPSGYSAADYSAATGVPAQSSSMPTQSIHISSDGSQSTTARTPYAVVPSVQPIKSAAQPAQQSVLPGQPRTQLIYIPNDMVGAIIGKGGVKINEIRQLSGSQIKINEPQEGSNERLVTISGTHESNQMALYLLYSRLDTEKHR
ncbi:uncharacterized protein V1516DRAFT_647080 [Lipomyces oligophaga]|uniref:uncharacterized protein n=1 Tax=Lipomyces oligophaga TaxID=45792 RepID=UPI0034CE0C1C